MKKIDSLDFSVAILAGLSCLFMYLQVPVWALFVGWAWYFALGAKPELIVKSILPTAAGSVLAVLTFILITFFSEMMDSMFATVLAVFIGVFLLMLTLKFEAFNPSLISFNAYSCMFVGVAAETFMRIDGIPLYLNAALWINGANILGLIFGWLSIKLSTIGKGSA